MINWKKEGYRLGENVAIVNKFGFYEEKETIIDGIVTHVGTKILKVSINKGNKEKELVFNGKKYCRGVVFGDFYEIYKTKEEYDKKVLEKEEVEKLKLYITDNLMDLNLDILTNIKKIIDKAKN